MNADVVATFRRAVEAGDSEAVLATLAPEIKFINPVSSQRFEGPDALAVLVPSLLDTWKDLRYVAQMEGDGLIALMFDAGVGSRKARGIDVLRLNQDGLIDEITVMVRPLKAVEALGAEMAPKLAAAFAS